MILVLGLMGLEIEGGRWWVFGIECSCGRKSEWDYGQPWVRTVITT